MKTISNGIRPGQGQGELFWKSDNRAFLKNEWNFPRHKRHGKVLYLYNIVKAFWWGKISQG